jgi:hypothetical protein
VHDQLERVRVGRGHVLEHVAGRVAQSSRDGVVLDREVRRRRRDDFRQIEHDTADVRVFLEYCDRERSITGADVDQRANAGEVVALEDADVGDGAVRLQRLAEFRERLRIGGEVVEEIHTELRAGLRVAGR